jgi:hypothetical protein
MRSFQIVVDILAMRDGRCARRRRALMHRTACQGCAQSIGRASAWRLSILRVALGDGPISEATDVESVRISAVHRRNEERRTQPDDPSIRASVEEAHRLVTQVVCILSDPICEQHPSLALRLARAHALTLLDHLQKLIA